MLRRATIGAARTTVSVSRSHGDRCAGSLVDSVPLTRCLALIRRAYHRLSEWKLNGPDLRQIPAIVVTGADIRPNVAVEQAKQILRKPCSPDRLVSVVERYVHAADPPL